MSFNSFNQLDYVLVRALKFMPHPFTHCVLFIQLPFKLLLSLSLPQQSLSDALSDIDQIIPSDTKELFEDLVFVPDLILRLLVLIREELAVEHPQAGIQILGQGVGLAINIVTDEVGVLLGDT